jgi:hypothetical protein
MAITLTRTVQRVETYPLVNAESETVSETKPTVMVVYNDVFDDPDDDQLPVTATKVKNLNCTDDVTGEDALVQTICTAIWA